MAKNDIQILIAVDLYPSASIEELRDALPAEREGLQVLRLTKLGAPRLSPPPDTSPIDWPGIGRAVEQVMSEVQKIRDEKTNPTVIFIGGRGPLAVFVHLGYLLSKFGGTQVVLNQAPGGGPWEHFPMEAAKVEGPPLLEQVAGLPVEEVSRPGRVGIYLDTAGRNPSEDVFEDFIVNEGDSVAGVIRLRSAQALLVSPDNISTLVLQLTQFLSRAPARYRRRSGLSLFVGGPAQVAFAVGRALNPTVLGKDIWLTEYRHPAYERVYTLPFATESRPEIPQGAEHENQRRKVLDAMAAGIADLKRNMKAEHLPDDVLSERERQRFIDRLTRLEQATDAKRDDGFRLRVIEGHYTLGAGILHALRNSAPPDQKDFAKLLIVHELLHDWQALRSTNYSAVGGAGVVLEQVDYAADAFAVRALMKMDLARGGDVARDEVRARLQRWLDMVLHGISSFDIMDQPGMKMTRLAERRLRRYLMWHLQLARAATIWEPAHVDEMLRPPLAVELAPLAGKLDTERYEKMVTRALPDTELFCAIGGHLVRQARRPRFEPGDLVEAVKSYSRDPIQEAMAFLVDEHRDKLAPWIMSG
ncbi:SAVED domain-containing protein [Sorangium sp. So ce1014]|uniref:SAVED domain-containing protein n=1 Tax=Sorangium sp. So ce1014 TaxID=3133326 RepID=UPI003F641B32